MSFASFAKGFLDQTNADADRRIRQADEYYERQLETARTRGVQALENRRAQFSQLSNLSNQLIHMGMPASTVRVLAQQGPEALQAALETGSQFVSAGIELNEDLWNDVWRTTGEVTADTGQSVEDFLREVTGLLPQHLEQTGDARSSFFASALGLNAMDRADRRLQTEAVTDGFSAYDLNRMAQGGRNRPLGDVNAFMDPQAVASVLGSVPRELSRTDIQAVVNAFRQETERLTNERRAAAQRAGGAGLAEDSAEWQEIARQAEIDAAITIMQDFDLDPRRVSNIPFSIRRVLPPSILDELFGNETPEQEATEAASREAEEETRTTTIEEVEQTEEEVPTENEIRSGGRLVRETDGLEYWEKDGEVFELAAPDTYVPDISVLDTPIEENPTIPQPTIEEIPQQLEVEGEPLTFVEQEGDRFTYRNTQGNELDFTWETILMLLGIRPFIGQSGAGTSRPFAGHQPQITPRHSANPTTRMPSSNVGFPRAGGGAPMLSLDQMNPQLNPAGRAPARIPLN